MHSATTATGRPLPPPGKTLSKNRPAPLSCRATLQLAAPKPHVTSQLQCYIPALIDNHRRSPRKINRKPRRLESAISPTKQTPAPQINRQQIATSRITHPSISNRHNQNAAPAFIRHCRSNRHTSRLENAISRRKQTLGTVSNRHFFTVLARNFTLTHHASRAIPAISNRQWQILEITKNPTKTHFSTVLIDTKMRSRRARGAAIRESRTMSYGTQFTNHYSPIATRASPATPNSLGAGNEACYGWAAFVALVTPLDSMKGLQVHTCGLFCFTAGGGREANK